MPFPCSLVGMARESTGLRKEPHRPCVLTHFVPPSKSSASGFWGLPVLRRHGVWWARKSMQLEKKPAAVSLGLCHGSFSVSPKLHPITLQLPASLSQSRAVGSKTFAQPWERCQTSRTLPVILALKKAEATYHEFQASLNSEV